jgi:polysaccharide export outer membrane protein
MNLRRILFLLAAASLAACGGSSSLRTPRYAPAEYRLGVEDVVQVAVWREPELDVVAPVRPDGKLTVPLAGELQAAGRTAREIEDEITQRLGTRLTSPVVSVVVKELNSSRIYVLGEVAKPGVYPLRGPTNLLEAIAVAGGLTEFAGKSNTVLHTDPQHPRGSVNFDDCVRGAPCELAPGDTVVVP